MSKTPKIKPLTKDQTLLLKNKYYKEKNYFGRDKLFNLIKHEPGHPTKEQVGEWLKIQQVHQLHLKQKKSSTLKPVVLKKPNSLYEMDIVDMGEDADENRYILTMVDVFSRYAYAQPIKTKTDDDVLKAFKKNLTNVKQITRLQTDNGSEFINSKMQNFLKTNNIKHVLTIPGKPQSNGIIERFNGTLKSMIQKDITASLDKKWSNNLQTYINNYNNSYHDTIKMTPVEATIKTSEALKNVENNAQKYTGRKYDDIKVGDKVRKKIFKGKLEKHSKINWSHELYVIEKVLHPKKPYNSTTYKIVDDKHSYARNDIQLIKDVKKPPKEIREVPEEEYEVEEILEKKKVDGRVRYLVKWRGWEEPTWDNYNNIKDTIAYSSFLKKKQK